MEGVDFDKLFDIHMTLIESRMYDQVYQGAQPVKCNPIEHINKMENYLNLFEHIPEDEHNHISNKIWEALDRAGIELSQDAELSIRIYDDEYEGEFDGREYDE